MIRRLITGVALTFAASLAVAGCDSATSEEPPDRPAAASAEQPTGSPAVVWAEQVCASVAAGAAELSKLPQLDPANPEGVKQSLIDYMSSLSSALQSVADSIVEAGEPPVRDGQAAVDKAMKRLTTTKVAVDEAATQLQEAEVSDQSSLERVVGRAGRGLEKLRTEGGPTADLTENPALKEAFAQAPICRKLDS
ncbi:MAG: hypothetical protein ACRDQ7_27675 [Haloechinothrix sp.]